MDIESLDRMHIAVTSLLVGYLVLFAVQVKGVMYYAIQRAIGEFLRAQGENAAKPGKVKSLALGLAWLLGSRADDGDAGEDDGDGDDYLSGRLFWVKVHTICIMIFVAAFVMFTSVSTKIRFDNFAEKMESMSYED